MSGGNVDLSPTLKFESGPLLSDWQPGLKPQRGTVQVKGQGDDDSRGFRFGFSGDDMLLQGRKTQSRRRRRG